MAAHRHPRMIAGPLDGRRLLTQAVLMVVPRRPHTVADQRLLTGAVLTDAQRPRTAVADTPMEAVEAERLPTVAVVVVTPAAEDPGVVGTLPAGAEDTQAAVGTAVITNFVVLMLARFAAFGRRFFPVPGCSARCS
jgi:hypothetical protein